MFPPLQRKRTQVTNHTAHHLKHWLIFVLRNRDISTLAKKIGQLQRSSDFYVTR